MLESEKAQLMRQVCREVARNIVAGRIPDVPIAVRNGVDGSSEQVPLSLLLVKVLA